MENIHFELQRLLKTAEAKNKYYVFLLQSKWLIICGDSICKHSKPVKLERKVLYINTDSPVWSNHLLMMKEQFLSKINEHFKYGPIKDLRFFVGNIENGFIKKKRTNKPQFKLVPLSSDDKQKVTQMMATIKNEAVKDELIRFKTSAWQRELTLLQDGKKKCPQCGIVITDNSKLCSVCELQAIVELRKSIRKFLLAAPWSDFQSCQKVVKCDTIVFESVQNELKEDYFSKISGGNATNHEKMIAVALKTGKSPEQFTEAMFKNVLTNLRGK